MVFYGLPAGLTALCLATLVQAKGSCFYPGGYLSDDVPCQDPSTGATMCCSSKAACLDTGLCKDISPKNKTSNQKFIRATCTDPSWSSSQCPQHCVQSTITPPSGEQLLNHAGEANYCGEQVQF